MSFNIDMKSVVHIFKKWIRKQKPDPVLAAAWGLAAISAIFVHPAKEYLSYIDWRSLGILWGLMVVIQGFRENTVFEKIGETVLHRVKYGWQLAAVLILMCFLGSMVITNDVALITFVPFAIMIMKNCKREDLMIPVVVLQTIAANLGSMLTPIGNPQNLYLYGVTGMSVGSFVLTMLPLALLTILLLGFGIALLPEKRRQIELDDNYGIVKGFGSKTQIILYGILFMLAIFSVLRVIPYYVVVILIFITVLIMSCRVLLHVDYTLLLTFIGFFIFTGNIGRIPQINETLAHLVKGREFLLGVLTSQVISNVPATLLLTGFAEDYKELLQGVNVGGLGTLIASMASLISYKSYTNVYPKHKGKYIVKFTVYNLVFLLCLCAFHIILRKMIG